MKKGMEKGAAAMLLIGAAALAVPASSASAALVSIARVVTNNTATTQTYQFAETINAGESLTNIGAFGSLSLTLTDLNRNGATLTSDSSAFYSGWINGDKGNAFLPGSSFTSYQLTAAPRGLASDSGEFGKPTPVALSRNLLASDLVEIRFNFTLSAGDQLAFSGAFNLIQVPAPSVAAMALLAPVLGRGRRKLNTASH